MECGKCGVANIETAKFCGKCGTSMSFERNRIKLDNSFFLGLTCIMLILIAISLVTVGTVTSSLTRREGKEEKEQIELAINSAKIYFSSEEVNCVKIQSLISKGYINDKNKINKLNVNYTIKLSGSTYVYSNSGC